MERITMSMDEALARDFDQLIRDRGYTSRSEAMRDLLRREIEAHREARDARSQCVANLSYVFNHHERKLSERLMDAQHQHHDLVVVDVFNLFSARPTTSRTATRHDCPASRPAGSTTRTSHAGERAQLPHHAF